MNLGIRDAISLGPVLVEHLQRTKSIAGTATRAEIDTPLRKWAEWRHEMAVKVVGLAKSILSFATWPDRTQWYCGVIPINWVTVRNLALWVGAGLMKRRAPWSLSGLLNR